MTVQRKSNWKSQTIFLLEERIYRRPTVVLPKGIICRLGDATAKETRNLFCARVLLGMFFRTSCIMNKLVDWDSNLQLAVEKMWRFFRFKMESIVTSGVYERVLEVDGKKYHHILDPHTGYQQKQTLRV